VTSAVRSVPVGARLVDSVIEFSPDQCRTLKANGVEGVALYLESLTEARLAWTLEAGLGALFVGYAESEGWHPTAAHGAQRGSEMVARAKAAGVLPGAELWRDFEGPAGDATIDMCGQDIEAGAAQVVSSAYLAGLYVGEQPLNGARLYALRGITGYWQALSRGIAEPTSGWKIRQLYPSTRVAGMLVDFDFAQQDFAGRSPLWQINL
jgi:Domain of unknown function (DUF1906)